MMTSPLGQQPFRCQIALQGGGAKILALLAAMESVQELQRQGTVKITRVAGTSAGSIVAALFAADIDLGAARQRLIASLTPDLAEAFALPGYTKLAWQLGVRSRPLWDEHRLAEILRRLFEPADVSTLNDVQARRGIAVHILASVLSDARKIVYVSGGADPKPLLPALLDSCAIPFCFRIWQPAGSVVVDGGLCENLPSDELLDHEKTDGPVIAISFRSSWPGTQQNLKDFASALLDTAMSNSVARAKTRLGLDRVCEIRTSLNTFDFDIVKADQFEKNEAGRIKKETADFVDGFITRQRRTILGDPWSTLNPGAMEDWFKIYQKQHANQPAGEYIQSSVVVQVNGLVTDQSSVFFGQPDYVNYTVQFTAATEMFCTQLGIVPSTGSVSLESSELELTDAQNNPVDFVVVPARDPANIRKRLALIYFTPTLPKGAGPYTLRLKQSIPAYMQDLVDKGKDELFLATKPSPKPVGQIDLVLHVPVQYTGARTAAQHGGPGRAMVAHEFSGYTAPPGFRTIGWRGQNIAAGSKFACDVLV